MKPAFSFVSFAIASLLSACAVPPPSTTTDAAPHRTSGAQTEWPAFSSEEYAISFRYPPRATVFVATTNYDRDEELLNVVAAARGTSLPDLDLRIISYADDPFYHPPAGTDVREWVLHNEVGPWHFDEVAAPRMIAGIQALHAFDTTPDRGSRNAVFFVLNGDRLYQIQAMSWSDRTAREYEAILDSIEFPDRGGFRE